MSQSRED